MSTSLKATPAKFVANSMTSVMAVLKRWSEIHPHLQQVARNSRSGILESTTFALSNARFLAPIPDPGTIFCAVANYRGHVTEVSKAVDLPAEFDPFEHGLNPRHIVKESAECVRESGSRISLAPKNVDWEAEIAVVIGLSGHRAAAAPSCETHQDRRSQA